MKVLKNGLIKYRFEKMIPITSERKPMDAALVDALTFAIHCLHGLYILHDIVNLVHGDISPNNILFSSLDNIWKLIDFDRSMPVHESERIKRISGTEGYISPESIQTGVFTRKSDIYSLGRVIFDQFTMPFLMNYIEFELYDSCQDVMTVFKSFETLNIAMLNPQPEIRPTASELLRDFYQLFRRFKHTNMDPIILSLKSILAIRGDETRV